MKPHRPLTLPDKFTAEEWERAFRKMEAAFARNKTRMWVLKCMRDELMEGNQHG